MAYHYDMILIDDLVNDMAPTKDSLMYYFLISNPLWISDSFWDGTKPQTLDEVIGDGELTHLYPVENDGMSRRALITMGKILPPEQVYKELHLTLSLLIRHFGKEVKPGIFIVEIPHDCLEDFIMEKHKIGASFDMERMVHKIAVSMGTQDLSSWEDDLDDDT